MYNVDVSHLNLGLLAEPGHRNLQHRFLRGNLCRRRTALAGALTTVRAPVVQRRNLVQAELVLLVWFGVGYNRI